MSFKRGTFVINHGWSLAQSPSYDTSHLIRLVQMSLSEEGFLAPCGCGQAHAACRSKIGQECVAQRTDLTCFGLETSIELNVVTRLGISPSHGKLRRSEPRCSLEACAREG